MFEMLNLISVMSNVLEHLNKGEIEANEGEEISHIDVDPIIQE